jgi:hypothetical protein
MLLLNYVGCCLCVGMVRYVPILTYSCEYMKDVHNYVFKSIKTTLCLKFIPMHVNQ